MKKFSYYVVCGLWLIAFSLSGWAAGQSSIEVQVQQIKGQLELDANRISRLEAQVSDLQSVSVRQVEIQGELRLFNSQLENLQSTTSQNFAEIKESTKERDSRNWDTFIAPTIAVLIATGIQQIMIQRRRKSFEEREAKLDELEMKIQQLLERKHPP